MTRMDGKDFGWFYQLREELQGFIVPEEEAQAKMFEVLCVMDWTIVDYLPGDSRWYYC